MTRARLALAILAILAAPATAAPRKVLVLPTDGNADAATRGKLTTQVARLAHRLDGQVATGDATFADTALAVGCAPDAPTCSDEVLATLGVDELVWATATRDAGATRVVVHRAAKASAARERTATIATASISAGSTAAGSTAAGSTAGSTADPLDGELGPLFGEPEPEPPLPAPAPAPRPPPATPPAVDRAIADRNTGIVIGAGAGVALLLGGALWVNFADLQDQIDNHPTRTRGDIDDLRDLEDRAQSRALLGDVFVVAGLAAGGVAAYFLFRDHHPRAVAIAPVPVPHGGGLTVTWRGDL